MYRLLNLIRRMPEHLRFKYAPGLARWVVGFSTILARRQLPLDAPLQILMDNSVLGNSVTHETAWVSTGPKMWGGHEMSTGYAARIPVHSSENDTELYVNVTYLSGIAHLAREGRIKLWTSAELRDEQFRQPSGRYRGYGYSDFSLFGDLDLRSIDKLQGGWVLGPSTMQLASLEEQQRQRIDNLADPLYKALLQRLGEKQSLDAWHIRTAEVHGLYCFLTMDFKLIRTVERWKNYEPFKSMKTRVITPVEFGKKFGLFPVPPHLHSYTDASFFVRSDLHMPGEKRRKASSYAK